jgi:RHS repeat-associated protein
MLIPFLLLGCLNFFFLGAGSPASPGVATAAASTPGKQPGPTQIVANTHLGLAFGAGGGPSCLSQSRGGVLSCIASSHAGAPPYRSSFDVHGQLSEVQSPFSAATQYEYNSWGGPESMTHGGQSYELFGSGDPLSWNLPGGVSLTWDDQGRLERKTILGLDPLNYSYDGDGRHLAVTSGLNPYKTYTYSQGLLRHLTLTHGSKQQDFEHIYDDYHRLKEVKRNGLLWGSWQYADPPQKLDLPKKYTDPNGAEQKFLWDAAGRLTKMDLADGPSIQRTFNSSGELLSLQVHELSVTFDQYEAGWPGLMTWHHAGGALEFSIALNEQGQLEEILGDGFELSLLWSESEAPQDPCAATEPASYPRLLQLKKAVPGYSETWDMDYTAELALRSVHIQRSNGTELEESYAPAGEDLPQLIPTRLKRTLDGQVILDLVKTLDAAAGNTRVHSITENGLTRTLVYDERGNLLEMPLGQGGLQLEYSPSRAVSAADLTWPDGSSHTALYDYDVAGRRCSSSDHPDPSARRVYAFEGSRVIAIGREELAGTVIWEYAIGHGPLGPVLLKDLTGAGNDYFIFTDHLGTPFGWFNPHSGTVYVTPYSPYGELLSTPESRPPPYAIGNVPAIAPAGQPLGLPPLSGYALPPLGLSGHLYDEATGLVLMHHRSLSPRLSHFTTVDYRTPNIYDPSTLTEPYAYARGNPTMFWDPNGLSWLGDFAKHSFEYFASGKAAENLTAFVDGVVDGTVGAVVQVVTETGNMAHDLGSASYSVHKYMLTGELHDFEMRSAIGKSAEQGNDGVAGAGRNLGGMAKGVVTAPLEMGKDLVSGDPRRMGQGLAKLEVALALAGARHGFTSPVSQVGKGVALDIKSTATTIIDKSKSLLSKKSSPPANITPPPTPTLSPNTTGRDALGRFTSKSGGHTADAARGISAHKSYRNALGANYRYEFKLPSGKRVDAVDFKNRVVRELKPDNPRAIQDGARQLERYRLELELEFGGKWTSYLDTYVP